MSVPEVAVGLRDEESAVLVADPGRDGLEIDAGLDCVADEIVAHAAMREYSKAGELVRTFHGLGHFPILLAGGIDRRLIFPRNIVPVAQMDRAVVS